MEGTYYTMEQVNRMMGNDKALSKYLGNHDKDLVPNEDYVEVSHEEYERITGIKHHWKTKCVLVTQQLLDKMLHKIPLREGGNLKVGGKEEFYSKIGEIETPITVDLTKEEEPKPVKKMGRPKLKDGEKGNYKARKPKVEKLEEQLQIPVVEEIIPQKIEATHTQNVTVTVDLNQLFQQFVNIQLQQFQAQQKQIEAQNKQISELTEMMKELISYQMEQPVVAPADAEDKYPSFDTWKKEINKATDKILDLNSRIYPTRNGIMSDAYKALTKEYGIVWDQSKKDFFDIYGRGPINTMELCWFIEQNPIYRNLLLAKLSNMYERASKETA